MLEDELYLTEGEYFRLEAHTWKKRELSLQRDLLNKDKEIKKRDIAILNFNIENQRRRIKELEDEAATLSVKIENVSTGTEKVKSEISKRLEIEEVTDWGYDPETLKIIL